MGCCGAPRSPPGAAAGWTTQAFASGSVLGAATTPPTVPAVLISEGASRVTPADSAISARTGPVALVAGSTV